MFKSIEELKSIALTVYLGLKPDEVVETGGNFEAEGCEYSVYTDEEADAAAREYILDSAWAFRYNFLCAHSEAISAIPQKDYEAMAAKLCEDFNKAVLAMIDDKDHFVKDAILSDGRGHFLSGYDGEELELDGGKFYAYRTN